ncbi:MULTISPECIES: anthranilate phosphoribosyltransferase [Methanosarcina]|uniref:Anthranilate phosphoribosyltransferase n=3 Tax=Methanosarcina barkeri TaxID=2208 RepID=A0A0E3QVZ0_METBA|nr:MULTISPECIES: anthranilate phosphoribosyltransferase [Methanosarcina]AKB54950.1 Anthranilate phosphoribosyltransferase [Methanosarcina barkeri MS]AKB56978.1 Anthranilate phosphoribosyltransferase [Methanosarcina barkeri 227]AKJ37545.1 anthranilate phosphoribosyltransferase TrpD [Methanosarcina barkeri CM1]OEC91471.1 anthranilate phosphoribosyltransferase [Methanosarcina sp. A14]
MQRYIQKLEEGHDLSPEEAEDAVGKILSTAQDEEIGRFLLALRAKGEKPEEIAGFVRGMKKAGKTIRPKTSFRLVDTCGTGGDGLNTINISTAAAIVTAAAGVPVAKHGNRAATSMSGSSDVLEALGIKTDLEPEAVRQTIEEIGIGFMAAPVFHPAMKRVAGIRKKLGVRTVFNILGPLTNPAGTKGQVIGVFDKKLCEPIAYALAELGTEHALVVNGDGMDEITNTGETYVAELKDGKVSTYTLTPEDLGMLRANPEDIKGGTPKENARDLLCIFKGQKGPKRDIVVLNAAAALYVGGIVGSIRQAIPIAEDAIDSGKVMVKFNQFRAFTSGFHRQESKGSISGKSMSMRSRTSILSPASGERA